jgi:hypothetical protein
LVGGTDATLATQNQPELNRFSASVAWLEVCTLLEADLKEIPYLAKTYTPL